MKEQIHRFFRKTEKKPNISTGIFHRLLMKMTLQTRLIILILCMMVGSLSMVGFISYSKAKETTVTIISNRLEREANTFYEIAQNLMYLYVGDEHGFMKKINQTVKKQHAELTQDGLKSYFFLITEESIKPFTISAPFEP
jgi:methyl-accepting chemotaxis protein